MDIPSANIEFMLEKLYQLSKVRLLIIKVPLNVGLYEKLPISPTQNFLGKTAQTSQGARFLFILHKVVVISVYSKRVSVVF